MTQRPTLAVVLAAGRGTRMMADAPGAPGLDHSQRAMARAGLKMLIPFDGRPFLAWVLDAVAAAGFRDACLVVGATTAAGLADFRHERLNLTMVRQDTPRGTADAVLAAESAVADRAFIVINGDNWYPPEAMRLLRGCDAPATVGFRPEERVEAFALMTTGDDGCLTEIVEKPDAAARARLGAGARVSMTCWSFTADVFDACRAIAPSPRGELELPDAVRHLMASGRCVRLLPHDGPVLDLGRARDIPAVRERLAACAQ